MAPTYFFDVSDILSYVRTESSISGIQRVSLALIKRMVKQSGPEKIMISFWTLDSRYASFMSGRYAGFRYGSAQPSIFWTKRAPYGSNGAHSYAVPTKANKIPPIFID